MEHYFYKRLTLAIKLNKNGKRTLKVSALTAHFGKETFIVEKQETNKEGCILILNVSVNNSEYIMINLCNANTEKKQINVLSNMFVLLEKSDINKKQVIIAGYFNLFFDSKLDVQGGNPTIKKKSLAKLIELKESHDLCDIWRVRNTNLGNSFLRRNILQVSFNIYFHFK